MIKNIIINTIMPRRPLQPDLDETIQIAATAWRFSLYNSQEACAKAHGLDPQTFRHHLNGKQQPYKVAHINQNYITVAGEDAITQHYIYLANARFLCRQYTVQTIATIVLR